MSNEEKIEIYKNAVKNIKKLHRAGVNTTLEMGLQDRAYYFTAEKLSQFKKRSQVKALNPGKVEEFQNIVPEGRSSFTEELKTNVHVSEKAAIERAASIEQSNENKKEEEMSK